MLKKLQSNDQNFKVNKKPLLVIIKSDKPQD